MAFFLKVDYISNHCSKKLFIVHVTTHLSVVFAQHLVNLVRIAESYAVRGENLAESVYRYSSAVLHVFFAKGASQRGEVFRIHLWWGEYIFKPTVG